MPPYAIMPHTADLRIRAWGATQKELFQSALNGMFESIAPKWEKEAQTVQRAISIQSTDLNALLVDFLSEALQLSDVNNEAYTDIEIRSLTNTRLNGTLIGKPIAGFDLEIKAVTHHGLDIKQVSGKWQAEIVFDI